MTPRWWRIGLLFERDGEPWTWTMHVRAPTRPRAEALVDEHLRKEHAGARRPRIYLCHPSEPLLKVDPTPAVAAAYGPYRRSWKDPVIAALRPML